MNDVAILVVNSNVKHQLTGSEYPQRRWQCQEAARHLGLSSLRDARSNHLEELKLNDCEDVVLRRAKHVIDEIRRTEEAAKCLQSNDWKKAGNLFNESHESLSKLMEVSCPELDELVSIVRQAPGVYGARMTGGGFGGCLVMLVLKKNLEEVKQLIRSQYKGTPTFLVTEPSDGARVLNVSIN